MRIQIILVLGFLHLGAAAQWAGEMADPHSRELPRLTPQTIQILSKKPLGTQPPPNREIKKAAERIGHYLTQTFETQLAPLGGKAPACGTSEFSDYLRALRTAGNYDQCLYRVRKCSAKNQFADFMEGAFCASANYDHKQTEEFYLRATDSKWSAEKDFDFAVFQFASYTLVSPRPELTKERLKASNWSPDEQLLALALIEKLTLGKTAIASDDQVNAFVVKLESHTSPWLKELAGIFSVLFLQMENKHGEALKVLTEKYSYWRNPLSWFDMAYSVFYQQDEANFQLAKSVYDGYRPFMHPMLRLPLEQNVFTYTEIENTVCRDHMSSGTTAEKLRKAKRDWTEGKMSTEDLRSIAKEAAARQATADVLTLLGSLDLAEGASVAATENFWKAHQLCPYYNRAHWGLALLRRQKSQNSYPDKEDLSETMRKELEKNPPVKQLSNYILNWSTLSEFSRTVVAYGSRFWRSYVPALHEAKKASYLKSVFELLSEVPGLKELRDQRISYKGDNRLWDDVRGAGGSIVIADLIEVQQTPFGAYNLLGHEMAHQFHLYTESARPSVFLCNDGLYAAAKARKKFADSYAGTNVWEYFAQGVTYEMIPESAPPRFGLNRSWIIENDPDQMSFLLSISESEGQLDRIVCPLTARSN